MRGEGGSPPPARFYHLYLGRFGRYDFYVGSVGIAANPIPKNTLLEALNKIDHKDLNDLLVEGLNPELWIEQCSEVLPR